jgi:hypothetical protein
LNFCGLNFQRKNEIIFEKVKLYFYISIIHSMSKCIISKRKKLRQNFTKQEDELIIKFVEEYGYDKLNILEKRIPNRNTKQIQERYHLYLDPKLNHSPYSPQEDELLLKAYRDFNGKWCLMRKLFTGRTDVSLKYRHKQLLKIRKQQESNCSDPAVLLFHLVFQNWENQTIEDFLNISVDSFFDDIIKDN